MKSLYSVSFNLVYPMATETMELFIRSPFPFFANFMTNHEQTLNEGLIFLF